VCPLLIPWLISTDDQMDTKTLNNNDPTTNNGDLVVVRAMKKIRYFYTAPIVKFCCHSVTMGTHPAAVDRCNIVYRLITLRAVAISNNMKLVAVDGWAVTCGTTRRRPGGAEDVCDRPVAKGGGRSGRTSPSPAGAQRSLFRRLFER